MYVSKIILFRYGGYSGMAEADPDTGLISGEVVGVRDGDMVTFQGRTEAAAERSFRDSVDVYLRALAAKDKD